jgi:activator of HSP90 ATPase
MKEILSPYPALELESRRQLVKGLAIVFGAFGVSKAWGATPQSTMKEIPSAAANKTRTSLHYEVDFKPAPQRIYEALLDSKQFAVFSGMPAEIDAKAGGAFSLFGGQIVGRNIELITNQRIVQAWRPAHWTPGMYSIVKFELKPNGSGSTLVLDHTGFPEGMADHLDSGWHEHYLNTLQKYFE